MNFVTHSAEETIALGRKIGARLRPGDIIAMEGTLGAGKTTITKGIASALGINEPVTSPTFTLVSEYAGSMLLYHMDVYRIDTAEDFYSIGAEDMLYGSGVCIIEWSEKIRAELPDSAITVRLQANADNSRSIAISNWPYAKIEGNET